MEGQIAAFQTKRPHVTVEPQVVPFAEYWTKLQTAIAGGSAFDTFWMNGPNFQVYASRGVLLDLQPALAGKFDPSAFPKSLIDLYSYKGHLYATPKDFDTIGLYYNKALFDAAKVPYPTADWTWADLREAAKKLTIREGNTVRQWGFNPSVSAQEVYLNFVFQNGGKILSDDGLKCTIDEAAACEAILFLYDLMKEGVSPTPAEMQANSNWQPAGNLFPSKIAMVTAGSWRADPLRKASPTVDVVPLPKGRQRATVIHGLGNAVWAKSPNQAEALEFVLFLGSKEAQQVQAQMGTVIPAMNGLQEAWAKAIPDMNLRVFLDATSYSVPYPVSPKGPEWLDKVDQTLRDGWLGNIPRDQICKKAAEAANAALAK